MVATRPAPEADLDHETQPPQARSGRGHLRLAFTLLALVVLVALLISQRGVIESSFGTLGHTNWMWVPLALALETGSIAAFARMQRELFRAGDKHATQSSVMGTTVAGNAISASVPVAGPQLGTAFAFRRFTRLGIDAALAGWTLIVSGVVSSLAAGLVVVAGAVLSGNDAVATTGAVGGTIAVGVVAVATLALRRPRFQGALERCLVWTAVRVQRLLHLRRRSPREAIVAFVVRLRTLRLRRGSWAKVLGLALTNWLADAAVLAVSILAIGGGVPWRGVLLAYGVRIAAGGISITPGGLGVVEGALAVALMGVGMQRPSAVAAVLLYRFISFWLVTGVGWMVYLFGQRGAPARPLRLARRRSWAM